ncbi:hypothetical protein Lalb_Chr10g0094271 [Lupinus albus]|uniref:Uncharacterized protein n=1 Tax=Lupinus albus TaxID=3870 RepID=A0A6A4PV42_LUPAL|nr:hypothetical protein Lalb_Chr10g0094271 [Lupinus albus]
MAVSNNWRRNGFSSSPSGIGRSGSSQPGRSTWNKNTSLGKVCTHYKKNGHTMKTCYKLHGFQANFHSSKDEQVNSISTRIEDQNQTEKQHNNAYFGLSKQQYQGLMIMIQQSSLVTPRPNDNGSNHDSKKIGSNVLSTTTTTLNKQAICNPKLNVRIVSWILDSGAIDHKSSSLSNFSQYKPIKLIRFKLRNGDEVIARTSGRRSLEEDWLS